MAGDYPGHRRTGGANASELIVMDGATYAEHVLKALAVPSRMTGIKLIMPRSNDTPCGRARISASDIIALAAAVVAGIGVIIALERYSNPCD
jgi:hypothetical protein